jgi:hypothetical protein
VFLNGAFGNVHHTNHLDPRHNDDVTRMGRLLAQDVQRVVPKLAMTDRAEVSARWVDVKVPLRDPNGPYGSRMAFPQLFGTKELYQAEADRLQAQYAKCRYLTAQVQCLTIGPDTAFVGIPGEYFAAEGLRTKMSSPLAHTFVVGQANDKLGSIRLAGKTCYVEDDTRTCLAPADSDWGRAETLQDSIAILKRNCAMAITAGSSLWWMEQSSGWFSHPEILRTLGAMETLARELIEPLPQER